MRMTVMTMVIMENKKDQKVILLMLRDAYKCTALSNKYYYWLCGGLRQCLSF